MRILFFIGLLSFSTSVFGQVPDQSIFEPEGLNTPEIQPEFPGGLAKLYGLLQSKMKYPKDARKAGVEGKVFVSFMIEKDGRVSPENVIVLVGLHPSIDAEAVRVVKLIPPWKPGRQDGVPVRVKMILPLTFKLG